MTARRVSAYSKFTIYHHLISFVLKVTIFALSALMSNGAVTLGVTSLPAFNRHDFGFVMRKNARAQKEMKIE
jgi:hypothetical protein